MMAAFCEGVFCKQRSFHQLGESTFSYIHVIIDIHNDILSGVAKSLSEAISLLPRIYKSRFLALRSAGWKALEK